MKRKLVLLFLINLGIILPAAAPTKASANMQVATDQNFTNQTLNFEANQTIYVRLTSESTGEKARELNLRDNNYNFISSYTLSRSGGSPYQYQTSLPSPQNSGYYSLEAKIESAEAVTTTVKTIKVGNVIDANSSVKVNIQNKVNTQSSPSESTEPQSQAATIVQGQADVEQESQSPAHTDLVDQGEIQIADGTVLGQKNNSLISEIGNFITRIWQFFWPF